MNFLFIICLGLMYNLSIAQEQDTITISKPNDKLTLKK